MKLYGFPRSSASYRVRIACGLKGLEPESALVNFRTNDQRSPEYLAIAPSGLVPALQRDDGFVLTQSLAILMYIDETHPNPPLLPEDPDLRLKVWEMALAVACDIHPLNNLRVLQYLEHQLGADEEQRNAWYGNWVRLGLAGLEAEAKRLRGDYCVGDTITLADVCLVPQMFNARRFEVDLTEFPNLVDIDARLNKIPEIDAAKP